MIQITNVRLKKEQPQQHDENIRRIARNRAIRYKRKTNAATVENATRKKHKKMKLYLRRLKDSQQLT